MRVTIPFFVVLLLCSGCREKDGARAAQKRRAKVGAMVKAHYDSKYGFEVRGPLTLAQFERESREFYRALLEAGPEEDVHGRTKESLEARIARRCDRIKLLRKEGDELYFFTSDRRSWSDLAGIDGYVLVRKKEIIDVMSRSMN